MSAAIDSLKELWSSEPGRLAETLQLIMKDTTLTNDVRTGIAGVAQDYQVGEVWQLVCEVKSNYAKCSTLAFRSSHKHGDTQVECV